MASIIPVGDKFRAQVRRAGHPTVTKTCNTEQEAKDWATVEEGKVLAGKKIGVVGKTGLTMGQAVKRFLAEGGDMSPTRHYSITRIGKEMGNIVIAKITPQDVVDYIKGMKVGPASGAVTYSYVRTILTMIKVGWGYHVPDILSETHARLKILKLIGKSLCRERRPTEDELNILYNHKWPTLIPMVDIIKFAIASTMRQAEITRIEYATLNKDKRTVVIEDRKHPTKKKGNHQRVPLLKSALDIIQKQERKEGDDRIFPFNPKTIGNIFGEQCEALGIIDLHFHDLRHEGTTRLFEMGYQVHEVQQFTGHEDLAMLQRYTHLRPEDLRRLDAPTQELVAVKNNGVVIDAATMEQFKMFQAMQAMMAQQKAA